jgi:hypothetical protein
LFFGLKRENDFFGFEKLLKMDLNPISILKNNKVFFPPLFGDQKKLWVNFLEFLVFSGNYFLISFLSF